MNSRLVKCKVLHSRLKPTKHKFWFNFFWFQIDLDEIKKIRIPFILEHNCFGLFSLYDIDHLYGEKLSLKENVLKFLRSNNEHRKVKSIQLLTSLRILGYVFNPVSYYFIEFEGGEQASIIEICNTFKEIKPYFVPSSLYTDKCKYRIETEKNFYISPFSSLDTMMDFKVQYQDKINVNIDVKDGSDLLLFTRLEGEPVSLKNLYWFFFRYPLVTLQVTFFIHFHALILFLKKVKFHRKIENQHLQQGMTPWRQIQKS